jgi:4-amino-4-deoxy-L-arabinose transferase-like glycosyltransferase
MPMHPLSSLGRRLGDHPLKTVFALALLMRLANLALLGGREAYFAELDTHGYWALGTALANPASFASALLSMTDRMPLYPLLLGGVQSLFGDAPWLVAIIQAALGAATCALIAALGALLSPLVGLIAGILAALSVNLAVYSTQILTDTLFLFFFTLMLLAGARFLRNPTIGLAALAGIAGGLSLATRPAVALLLVAAIPLVFVIALVQRRGSVPALAAAIVFALTAAAPIAPVLARNLLHYGTWSLTAQTGEHLAFWIVPLVAQRADGTPYQATVDRVEALYRQRAAERGLSTQSNPFRLAAVRAEVARDEMARLPLDAFVAAWLEGMVVNLGAPALLADPRVRALSKPSFYDTPGRTLWEKSRVYLLDNPGLYQALLIVGLLTTLPFVVLAAVGLAVLARRLPWAALLAFGVLAYFLLINGPVATPKYRLPIEPVLIVLAAIPLAWLARRWCGRSVSAIVRDESDARLRPVSADPRPIA